MNKLFDWELLILKQVSPLYPFYSYALLCDFEKLGYFKGIIDRHQHVGYIIEHCEVITYETTKEVDTSNA